MIDQDAKAPTPEATPVLSLPVQIFVLMFGVLGVYTKAFIQGMALALGVYAMIKIGHLSIDFNFVRQCMGV